MGKILNYLRENWLVLAFASFILGGFIYLTNSGNRFCDCATTEVYKDGTTRSHSSGHSFYRYYHK